MCTSSFSVNGIIKNNRTTIIRIDSDIAGDVNWIVIRLIALGVDIAINFSSATHICSDAVCVDSTVEASSTTAVGSDVIKNLIVTDTAVEKNITTASIESEVFYSIITVNGTVKNDISVIGGSENGTTYYPNAIVISLIASGSDIAANKSSAIGICGDRISFDCIEKPGSTAAISDDVTEWVDVANRLAEINTAAARIEGKVFPSGAINCIV